MDGKNIDVDKIDDVMLPGFRFHPTDEELVGFYLKRKIQQRSLPIELIKQVDIYKYDPWDLPKLAMSGEKEWYFYCPRDRKYRNSARPNRVTGAGFWKATGTDRPIYSSDSTNKCIGLKKSLVFYRGRASKGLKTDWMMHEFRLPTTPDSAPPKKFLDKNFPLNDSWAICRIFKKTNSMANRAFTHPWVNVLSEAPEAFNQFSSENNISSTTENNICGNNNNELLLQPPSNYFSPLNIPTYNNNKPLNGMLLRQSLFSNPSPDELPYNFIIPSSEPSAQTNKIPFDSMLFNTTTTPTCLSELDKTSSDFEESQHLNNFSSSQEIIQTSMSMEDSEVGSGNIRSIGFPFSLASEQWKPNFSWDSSPPCPPSEISSTTTYSTTKSYT